MFNWKAQNALLRVIETRCFASIFLGLVFFIWSAAISVAEVSTAADLSTAGLYIEQGQNAKAVEVLKERTKNQADDHNAWFLLGVAYTNLQQFDDAIRAFQQVSTLQPDLAEPHNNIAVIHNEMGDYRAAVQELETAVQKAKGYTVAEENLGDLYVKLALQHYQKVLDKNPTPSLLKRYQNLIKGQNMRVMVPSEKRKPVKSATVPDKSVKVVQKSDVSSLKEAVVVKIGKDEDSAKQAMPDVSSSRETAVAKVSKGDSESTGQALKSNADNPIKADTKKSKESLDGKEQVLAAVESWRGVWSAQDVTSYFGHYAEAFQTLPRFASMEQWKKYKKRVISTPKFIKVVLSDIKVKLDETGNRAEVSFHQLFTNDRIREEDVKVLVMEKQKDSWKILRESVKE